MIVLLIISSIYSMVILDEYNEIFGTNIINNKRIEYNQTQMGENGFYKTNVITRFESGYYSVSIHTIGKNGTMKIITNYDVIEKNFNGTKHFDFDIKVDSTIWQGIMIEDLPDFNFSDDFSKLTISYKKIDKGLKSHDYILLILGGIGGVLFAANEAHIYCKKRE